ncbi:MAG: phosphate/phosphite/phosphonate ABC transporter substrate-binding protein [Bacteroidota bacterium]
MQKKKKLIWTLILLVAMTSCGVNTSDYANPKELIVCLSITEDYDKTVNKVEAFQSYLSKTLDLKVKVFKVTNGSAVIEAMKAKKVHLGYTGAFSYITAKSRLDIRPIVTTAAIPDDTTHNYWSCLIVPSNSPINTLDDLKREKENLTLAWAYPTSTSGHLVPRSYLQGIGITQDDFKEVMVSENHVASVYNCITGKVDVAAVNNISLNEYLRRGKIKPDDFKTLWQSGPIPRGAFFVNSELNDELIRNIQQALTNLHKADPESSGKIHYQYDYGVKYMPIDDSYYDSLRMMAVQIGLLNHPS